MFEHVKVGVLQWVHVKCALYYVYVVCCCAEGDAETQATGM
jgi:hypothetical protein